MKPSQLPLEQPTTGAAVPALTGPGQFRTRLILLLILVVGPVIALVIYGNIELRQTQKEAARQEAAALSRLVAAYEESYIKTTRQLLATLNQFAFLVLSTNKAFCETNFINLRLLYPDYKNFGLIETNGQLFCSAEPDRHGVSLKDRSYFQRVLRTGDFAIGDFQVGRITGEPGLNFGFPVRDEKQQLRRVLYASLKLSRLSEPLKKMGLPKGAAIMILDQNGSVLAREPESELWVGKSLSNTPATQAILTHQPGVMELQGIDKISRLYATTVVGDGKSGNFYVSVGIPSAVSFARADRILIRNILVLLFTGVIIAVLARLYAWRYFLRPVQSLELLTKQVAEGNYITRITVSEGPRELVALGEALNQMAERLQKRQSDLETANQQITRLNQDLEHRVKERTRQLEQTNKELEAFSYSVSHDLRAPLRHIRGFADFLSKDIGESLTGEALRYLKFIHESAKTMDELIENLLSFSRMARAELHVVEIGLTEIVDRVKKNLEEQNGKKEIDWQIGMLPRVSADPNLMTVVFTNLLANALKYSRARNPPRIEIGSQAGENEHVIFVRDNGVGFDMEYAHKLFGVFQRLHDQEEFEGTGIGLANVKRVILRHGGRVWAEGAENLGATFYFALPTITP